jgi:hypothetical protein
LVTQAEALNKFEYGRLYCMNLSFTACSEKKEKKKKSALLHEPILPPYHGKD